MTHFGQRLPIISTALVLSACSLFEYQASKPLLQAKAKEASASEIFAVGAERRIILVQPKGSDRQFCSEPPPDVAQAFADSVRAAVQIAAQQQSSFNRSGRRAIDATPPGASASAPAPGQTASNEQGGNQGSSDNASLSLARDFATNVSQIYTRSQGVQLFRDGAFMLCQAHLNQAVRGDRLEEKAKLAIARGAAAQEFQRADEALAKAQSSSGAPEKAAPKTRDQYLQLAITALPDPDFSDPNFNYSGKFTQLLDTVHSVLIQELPHLYRYNVEEAKRNAVAAADRADAAKIKASAAASAAVQAETTVDGLRNQAASSAQRAAEASASAAAASVSAKAHADAAAAAASAATRK